MIASAHSWAAGHTVIDNSELILSFNSEVFSVASTPTVLLVSPATGRNVIKEAKQPKLWPPPDRDLIEAVRTALQWMPEDCTVLPFVDFSLTRAAVQKNLVILK